MIVPPGSRSSELVTKLSFSRAAEKSQTSYPSAHFLKSGRVIWPDCAQLIGYAPLARRWVDLGSGAGFPGMVIAILLAKMQGGAEVHCVESDQRECAFLREVARATDAPARIHAARIEMFDPCALSLVDAVTSRALAALPRLFELANEWLMLRRGRNFTAGTIGGSADRNLFGRVSIPIQKLPK